MPNRLAKETSPYLLQHADNPVDWYPWGDAAFALAAEAGKPVLLSIGYSACHWCHVMEHESFEDEATARVMNELFVNIKVDREERPDIDKIYQTAHQLLTQRPGGWPLTMFLDGETRRPFFGGTYFPNEPRHGMPAFTSLLEKVAAHYAEHREVVREQGERMLDVFARLEPAPAEAGTRLGREPLAAVRETLANSFDREYGGFGGAPKFPHPTTIERLLRHWRSTAADSEPDVEALFMAALTLARMAEGGLFDHLGGGFYRYSVDQYWQIPHFEKMLDDMRDPNGGFYATRDADSEGHEGLYYLWDPEEVRGLIGDDYEVFARRYGLDQDANFEGRWHLTVRAQVDEDEEDRIERARKILLAHRAQRVPPARDEKQLTAWNALAIRGLAIAGRALDRPDLVDAAAAAVDFIRSALLRDGRLLASYKDGQAKFAAYLDDHAFLLDALLELLQSRWDSDHLAFARQLADLLLEHFEDGENGGFFFTANDHETLIHRPKPLADEAVPSGNGIAALALQRLGYLLGETRYLDAAESTLRAAWRALDEYPHGHVSLLAALEEYLEHPEIIIIRGEPGEIARWRDSAAKVYAPRRLVFAIPAGEAALPGALDERAAIDGETVAYRCVGTHCELPVTSWEALAAQMAEHAPGETQG